MRPIVDDFQKAIVRYLESHARAAETAEGVSRVWLGRRSDQASIAQVQEALDLLVESGALERHMLPGGMPVYRKALGGESLS